MSKTVNSCVPIFCDFLGSIAAAQSVLTQANLETYTMPKSLRRRCDARLAVRESARDRAVRAGELAKYLRRNRCKNWAVRGKKRCRLHGGLSTEPTTPEGKARTAAAMKAGRARWLARLKSEGKPIPCGRRKGGVNRSAAERQLARASNEYPGATRPPSTSLPDVSAPASSGPGSGET